MRYRTRDGIQVYDVRETYEQYVAALSSPKPCINLYRALCIEVETQHNALPSDLRVTFGSGKYVSPESMFNDIRWERKLHINTDGNEFAKDHPLNIAPGEIQVHGSPKQNGVRITYNLLLRAVHDFYGHYLTGSGFDWEGECIAFEHHSKMFSRKLRGILKGEVLGQAAYVLTTGEFISPQPMVDMGD